MNSMSRVQWSAVLAIALMAGACAAPGDDYRERASDAELLLSSAKQLTDVMVYDIFSPPQAARAYAYPSIAAYEALAAHHPGHRSLAGQLRDLESLPAPPDGEVLAELSAVHAFLNVARALVFSENRITSFHDAMLERFRRLGVPRDVFDRSVEYGDRVSEHILAWAATDGYRETRTYPRYTVTDEPGRWIPTPPAYLDGVEPHWDKIRPFVLESADQFRPPPPTPYSIEEGSQFYREAYEVYSVGISLSQEQTEIAAFWDCNPYVMNTRGHVMFAKKKITPGGHWMGISAIAARKAGADMITAARAYALASIALSDAFIVSWEEKFRSNLVRPETVINRYIDEDWMPMLQTPPFPEYTSGHSVISTAAGIVLTSIYGESFAYEDTTEVEYGLTARSFASFRDASAEAAISRLYGGIHYMPAIENGIAQGRQVGEYVVEKVVTREESLAEAVARESASNDLSP